MIFFMKGKNGNDEPGKVLEGIKSGEPLKSKGRVREKKKLKCKSRKRKRGLEGLHPLLGNLEVARQTGLTISTFLPPFHRLLQCQAGYALTRLLVQLPNYTDGETEASKGKVIRAQSPSTFLTKDKCHRRHCHGDWSGMAEAEF